MTVRQLMTEGMIRRPGELARPERPSRRQIQVTPSIALLRPARTRPETIRGPDRRRRTPRFPRTLGHSRTAAPAPLRSAADFASPRTPPLRFHCPASPSTGGHPLTPKRARWSGGPLREEHRISPVELGSRTGRLAAEDGSFDAARHARPSRARHDQSPAVGATRDRPILGLPVGTLACVFDLDGVLTASADVHAAAWRETLDTLVRHRVDRAGQRFSVPYFDLRRDYDALIHGKPRLEGIHAFLASRGITLPEGEPSDAPGSETVHGIANRKNELFKRRLARYPLVVLRGSPLSRSRSRGPARSCGRLPELEHTRDSRALRPRSPRPGVHRRTRDGTGGHGEEPAPDTVTAHAAARRASGARRRLRDVAGWRRAARAPGWASSRHRPPRRRGAAQARRRPRGGGSRRAARSGPRRLTAIRVRGRLMAPMTPMEQACADAHYASAGHDESPGRECFFSRHGLGSLPNRIQGGAP